jgi:hypothetical protein
VGVGKHRAGPHNPEATSFAHEALRFAPEA